MRKFLNLLLSSAVATSGSFAIAAEGRAGSCRFNYNIPPKSQWVRLGDGETISQIGVYGCQNCGTTTKGDPNKPLKSSNCEKCGGQVEKGIIPVSELHYKSGGQIYVPRDVIVTSAEAATFFTGTGPDWACSYCASKNKGSDGKCVDCGSSQAEKDAKFDPDAANRNANPNTFVPAGPAPQAPSKSARVSEGLQRARDAATSAASSAVTYASDPARRKTLLISASVAAGLAASSVAGLLYAIFSDNPPTGTVVGTSVEIVIFESSELYERYRATFLDLANPPAGVTVIRQKDVSLSTLPPQAKISDKDIAGHIQRQFYVDLKTSYGPVTVSVSEDMIDDFKVGDKVELRGTSLHPDIKKKNK